MTVEKRCTKCKRVKHVSCFNREKRRRDGYASNCRECYRLYRHGKRRIDCTAC